MTTTTRNTISLVSKNRNRKSAIRSAFNVDNNKEEYIVYLAAPGLKRDEIRIYIKNRELTVSANKKEIMHCFTQNDNQGYSTWSESFTLPKDADTIMTAAVYRNGELQIHIPKGLAEESEDIKLLHVY